MIIDNLETVIDDRVRAFLGRLPMGSKVLITSRIGLGAYEYPYKLQPMDEGDAVQLLRALTKLRGVEDLSRMENVALRAYTRRLNNNPLFIKWFVSAVQSGKRPEDVMAHPNLFLEYCMSNVYNYLESGSQRVIKSMLCIPGRHSQAELAYLNEMDAINLKKALQQLLTTNMVVMTSVSIGTSYESYYDLSEMARSYLAKFHPVEPESAKLFIRKRKQLVSAAEQFQADQSGNPFSLYSIALRSKNDLVVAKSLLEALERGDKKDSRGAEAIIAEAKDLAPEYYEVHRVDAIIKLYAGNIQAARDAYETAIALEPRSAPLRYWYGGFLMREFDDTEEAYRQLSEAERIQPNEFLVKLELTRATLYLKRYQEARMLVDSMLQLMSTPGTGAEVSSLSRKKLLDLDLQYYQRLADDLYFQHDNLGCVEAIRGLVMSYEKLPSALIDSKMKMKLTKSLPTARRCLYHLESHDARLMLEEMMSAIILITESPAKKGLPPIPSDEGAGTVVRTPLEKGYGFIRTDSGHDLYFHRDHLSVEADWGQIHIGKRVRFVVDQGPTGLYANKVELLN